MEQILFQSRFEVGATVYPRPAARIPKFVREKNSIWRDRLDWVYRVTACTRWDDDHERIIVRDDDLMVIQREIAEPIGEIPCNRFHRTNVWKDVAVLGPASFFDVLPDDRYVEDEPSAEPEDEEDDEEVRVQLPPCSRDTIAAAFAAVGL